MAGEIPAGRSPGRWPRCAGRLGSAVITFHVLLMLFGWWVWVWRFPLWSCSAPSPPEPGTSGGVRDDHRGRRHPATGSSRSPARTERAQHPAVALAGRRRTPSSCTPTERRQLAAADPDGRNLMISCGAALHHALAAAAGTRVADPRGAASPTRSPRPAGTARPSLGLAPAAGAEAGSRPGRSDAPTGVGSPRGRSRRAAGHARRGGRPPLESHGPSP